MGLAPFTQSPKLSPTEYKKQKQPSADISVNFSGTTGGFRQFCAGKTDISNASRPIRTDEIEACNRNNIRFIELPIAFDALTIAVNKKNTWIDSITLEELKKSGTCVPG
jgi:phosphate transport system substrate-binding protein